MHVYNYKEELVGVIGPISIPFDGIADDRLILLLDFDCSHRITHVTANTLTIQPGKHKAFHISIRSNGIYNRE